MSAAHLLAHATISLQGPVLGTSVLHGLHDGHLLEETHIHCGRKRFPVVRTDRPEEERNVSRSLVLAPPKSTALTHALMVLLDALIALPFDGEHVAVGIHPQDRFPIAHGDRGCCFCVSRWQCTAVRSGKC